MQYDRGEKKLPFVRQAFTFKGTVCVTVWRAHTPFTRTGKGGGGFRRRYCSWGRQGGHNNNNNRVGIVGGH